MGQDWTPIAGQHWAPIDNLAALGETPEPNPDRKAPKVISRSLIGLDGKGQQARAVRGYGLNYPIEIDNAVIVDVEATPARTYDEVEATKTMIDCTEHCFDLKPKRLAADTAYGTGRFLGWLVKDKKISPHRQERTRGWHILAFRLSLGQEAGVLHLPQP